MLSLKTTTSELAKDLPPFQASLLEESPTPSPQEKEVSKDTNIQRPRRRNINLFDESEPPAVLPASPRSSTPDTHKGISSKPVSILAHAAPVLTTSMPVAISALKVTQPIASIPPALLPYIVSAPATTGLYHQAILIQWLHYLSQLPYSQLLHLYLHRLCHHQQKLSLYVHTKNDYCYTSYQGCYYLRQDIYIIGAIITYFPSTSDIRHPLR
jgi:hypothetical protein